MEDMTSIFKSILMIDLKLTGEYLLLQHKQTTKLIMKEQQLQMILFMKVMIYSEFQMKSLHAMAMYLKIGA